MSSFIAFQLYGCGQILEATGGGGGWVKLKTLKLDLGSNSSSVRYKPWGPKKVSKIYLNFGFHAYKMETTTDTPQKTVVRTSGRQHTSHTG